MSAGDMLDKIPQAGLAMGFGVVFAVIYFFVAPMLEWPVDQPFLFGVGAIAAIVAWPVIVLGWKPK